MAIFTRAKADTMPAMAGQVILDLYHLFPERVKALVIAHSDARGGTPVSAVQRLANADRILACNIPGAQLVCIEGAGHLPNMETPVDFDKAIDLFFERIRS